MILFTFIWFLFSINKSIKFLFGLGSIIFVFILFQFLASAKKTSPVNYSWDINRGQMCCSSRIDEHAESNHECQFKNDLVCFI
jgi:hypothetical protein